MKLKLVTAAVAAAALATPGVAAADTGVYVNLGYTQFNFEEVDLGGLTGRLGYRFHPNFAVEGEASFGVADDNVGPVSVELDNAIGIFGVGFLPVAPNADLFARIGYGQIEAEASTGGFTASGDGDGFGFGAGGQYMFTPAFGVRGEYTRIEGEDDGSDTFSLSGVFKFGPR